MSKSAIFSTYFKDLAAVAHRGDAREESFYPALAKLLDGIAQATGRAHVHVTTLPRPTDGGNPDFRLWNGKDRIIGYIEAKKPTEEGLDRIEHSEQLKRYRSTFPNLILTNFLEFRLYRNGQREQTVLAARPLVLNRLRLTPTIERPDELYALLDRLPRFCSSQNVHGRVARRRVGQTNAPPSPSDWGAVSPGKGNPWCPHRFLRGLPDLPHRFADARRFRRSVCPDHYLRIVCRPHPDQGRLQPARTAFDNIPHTIGLLRDLFRFISLGDLPVPLAWRVDDIAEVLAVADAPGILDRYYQQGKGSDPVVHFYETFLARYDPEERERRGVYYTPEPVVGYIVRSLHGLLKKEFGKVDGLASDGVTLLDPAAGTMTFVARAAQQAVAEFEAKYGSGGREDFIRRHILRNFYALELMMAPYAVGHLKMGFFLEELGHRLADDERVPFYLTNSLEMTELGQTPMPFYSALAEESRLAGAVKKQIPILLILGNPPYSGHSSNRGDWIRGLIEDYKQVDGKPLGEKNPKWLQDDYVKFLRFAQWKIEGAGRGVVGIITNHGYLDNPTFRGMRRSLMGTFDDIYILDLHGNTLKRETCPDGSPDKNVFDIRQGVAIAFLVKRGNANIDGQDEQDGTKALVHHAERYGTRGSKYAWLDDHDRGSTQWRMLNPASPFYLFVPRDVALEAGYRRFISVPEAFPVNSVGIVTARDRLTIHWSDEDVWTTVRVFSGMNPELARDGWQLGKDARDWKVTMAQKDLRDSGPALERVVPILYRPFDVRHTYYTGRSRGFLCMPRPEVMRHMLAGENLALHVCRQIVSKTWQHCFVTNGITDDCYVSNKTRERGYTHPLYLYPTADRVDLFAHPGLSERQTNLNPKLVSALSEAHGRAPSPEEIFHYVYAVLYAPTYRRKYAEFLRIDFPRVPFTTNRELFAELADLGARLAGLHLLKSPELDPPTCRFEGQGDARVAKTKAQGFRYDADEQRLYVNRTQYFGPLPREIYEYRIGGYQVFQKWLKDRKERRLGHDDIRTYCQMVTAVGHTLTIQHQIDALYPDVERDSLMIPA